MKKIICMLLLLLIISCKSASNNSDYNYFDGDKMYYECSYIYNDFSSSSYNKEVMKKYGYDIYVYINAGIVGGGRIPKDCEETSKTLFENFENDRSNENKYWSYEKRVYLNGEKIVYTDKNNNTKEYDLSNEQKQEIINELDKLKSKENEVNDMRNGGTKNKIEIFTATDYFFGYEIYFNDLINILEKIIGEEISSK